MTALPYVSFRAKPRRAQDFPISRLIHDTGAGLPAGYEGWQALARKHQACRDYVSRFWMPKNRDRGLHEHVQVEPGTEQSEGVCHPAPRRVSLGSCLSGLATRLAPILRQSPLLVASDPDHR